jgi:hypothetical protein
LVGASCQSLAFNHLILSHHQLFRFCRQVDYETLAPSARGETPHRN